MGSDGGPVFPRVESESFYSDGDWRGQDIRSVGGMSLRAYIATKALAGLLSAPPDAASQDLGPNARLNPSLAASEAVRFADALLAELAKETP